MCLLRFLYLSCGITIAILFSGSGVYAQRHHKNTSARSKPSGATDTVVVYKKEEEKKKPAYLGDFSKSMRKKVTVISPPDTAPKKRPTYKDTVIVLKKGPSKEERAAMEKKKMEDLMKKTNYCSCVKMDVKVSTALQRNTYLDYTFIFKNNCKIDVWVSSKHFRFTPYNAQNKPVKVLQKLSFVERYDLPAFARIPPGETFSFRYADDAFFEYDLKKGESYKFVFEHRNFGDRCKPAPEKTYLCGQKRTQLITVK